MDVNAILEEVGLSEKEAIIYLSLLRLGESTASRVSEISDLNRITTYVVLKSLKEKGFCSVYDKNKVQYFKPAKPENILAILDEKKNKVNLILPLLKKEERKIQEKPEISLFEGKKGMTSMFDTILKDAENNKEVHTYGNFGITEKVIEYQSLHWRKTRLLKKIKLKAVVDYSDEDFTREKKWRSLSEIRFNKKLKKINSYTLISENFVAYLTFSGELVGVLIKNKDVADKERLNFEILWEQAKK